jgi:tRNA-guanine family transglycosylase
MRDAIYIPAYSDTLMNMLEKDDAVIREEYQPDFNEKKSLRIYNKLSNSYFKNNYMLISAGAQYRETDYRKKLQAEDAMVFVDSGGYQLAHSTVNHKVYTDKVALEWSEKNGDVFPILDRPTFTLGMMRDGKQLSPYNSYQECLDLTVTSAKYYSENRTREDAKILNVIQGQTIPQIKKWYDAVSPYKFEGWAYGGTKGNLGRIVPAILFLIKNGEFDRPECKYFHIFGVTSNESMIYFQYLQMLLNKHGIDIQITYDSTYWNRTCVFGGYFTLARYIVGTGMSSMNWPNTIDYTKLSKDFRMPCNCPICTDLTDVYGLFNHFKKNKQGEETIRFKCFNMNMAFHNLYLQLEYLDNVTRVLKCGMQEIFKEFFQKKIYDNLLFLDEVFMDINKDWEGELKTRFLKVETPPIVKVTDSSLAGFM